MQAIAESPTGACIRLNPAHHGLEIAFPTRPDSATIQRLKDAGFRFNGAARVWYQRHSAAAEARAYDVLHLPCPQGLTQQLDALADEALGLHN